MFHASQQHMNRAISSKEYQNMLTIQTLMMGLKGLSVCIIRPAQQTCNISSSQSEVAFPFLKGLVVDILFLSELHKLCGGSDYTESSFCNPTAALIYH